MASGRKSPQRSAPRTKRATGDVATAPHGSRPEQVYVRLQSGVLVAITQPVNPALARGMRVYVEGQGHDARVVPA